VFPPLSVQLRKEHMKKNTTEEKTKEKTIEEKMVDEDLDLDVAKILEMTDLSLPGIYQLDIMGNELLAHLTSYHQTKAALKSARNTGDHKRSEELYKSMSFSRMAVAVIEMDNPGAKAVADEIATFRATTAVSNRRTALDVD